PPPTGTVTTTVSLPAVSIADAAEATLWPLSRVGAPSSRSRTRTDSRFSVAGSSTSSPSVPRISSSRVTISGTGCWARRAPRTSRMRSSGSHSAPSGTIARSRSPIGAACLGELAGELGGDLTHREHPHRTLVLVHHQRGVALLLPHQRDHLPQLRRFVDQQRRTTQDVARDHVGHRRPHRVASGACA